MQKGNVLLVLTCLLAGMFIVTAAQAVESWDFSDVAKIKLDGVCGDITILESDNGKGLVECDANVRPARAFTPEVEQKGDVLYIDEEWSRGSSNGEVKWTIYLPKRGTVPQMDIETASGDLTCRGVEAQFDFETASGDIELFEVILAEDSEFNTASGDIKLEDMTVAEDAEFSTASGDVELSKVILEEDCEFSTASGDVEASDSQGHFALSTASGDVEIENCELLGQAEFSSASGNVKMAFDQLPEYDITASSASGDVYLICEEFNGDFKLVMTKREDKGRISCPFDYTDEYMIEEYHDYEVKVVEQGSGGPEIELRTASGKVVVRD